MTEARHVRGAAGTLAGRGVLITRPREQAVGLAEAVLRAGGRPVLFPALEILDPPETDALRAVAARLDELDLAIFVSPTAARRGLALVRSQRSPGTFPPTLRIAAIGAATATVLQQHGITRVIVPEAAADSEALLELDALSDVRGKRIAIFRGTEGRELLGQTLTARGAAVTYVACYRRGRPQADVGALLHAWRDGRIAAVTVMSAETLTNLCAMIGPAGQALLRETPLFVPHERIATAARAAACRRVVVAGGGEAAIVDGMIGYFTARS
jgi:uroporphyrinogen-III synthase